ncbi:hypothetical protein ARSEF4850_003938 [Beauveria asiatica]
MEENAQTPHRGFAFNPHGLWGFRTSLSRVRRRIIRVSWRKGLALSTEQIAAWNDTTDAGFTFSLAETTLNPADCDSFVVVVGEFIPMAARIGTAFPTYYKSPKESDKGLRKSLKWITLEEDRPRCLVVRKIDSPTNTFHVLVYKDTVDGLCSLAAAPGMENCRHYIAFYNEWAGSVDARYPSSMHKSIKHNLDSFCRQSVQKFRSSIPKPPALSERPFTLFRRETQGHAKIPALQQTVTNPAEKQSQAEKTPSTIVTQTTKEVSPKPLQPQEQSKDASISMQISPPLQTALEPGQQPQRGEASSNTPHTEPATTGLQNLARIEQNSKGCQTVQDSPVQISKGCQTVQDSSVQSSKGCQTVQDSSVQSSKGCQTVQVSPVQNSEGCQTLQDSPVQISKGCQTVQVSPVQNSKGCQTLQESPVQSGPSEMSKMDTCLARLFTLDDEYTPSDALELLEETTCASCIGDLAMLLRHGALQGHTVQPDLRENTQQFTVSASLRTNPVCDSLSIGQSDYEKYDELAQRNGLGLAKGCIERTIRSANLAVANLDALLPGHGSTNDVASGLDHALYNLREQLPAITDAFSVKMRNNILSLAHCAQTDEAVRIREVREVVMGVKVTLETLLQNLDVIGKSITSASRIGNAFEGKVDKEGDCDMELGETIEEMLRAAWVWILQSPNSHGEFAQEN